VSECPSCRVVVEESANFCPRCGASLRLQAKDRAIDRMIQDARRAVDDDPRDASARHNLALAYKLGGLEELALEEFARVTELEPAFGDAYYEMAIIQARSGRRDEAVVTLRRALEVEPDHRRAQQLLERLGGPPQQAHA